MKFQDLCTSSNKIHKILTYNDQDDKDLPLFGYLTKNLPNLDSELLESKTIYNSKCSCTDGCLNSNCPCIKSLLDCSTEHNIKYLYPAPYTLNFSSDEKISKKLNPDYDFGMIFECNQNCGCDKRNCRNSLIYNSKDIGISDDSLLVMKYKKFFKKKQNFTTMWGLMTLVKIPQFSYLFEYVGEIITKKEADKRGKIYDKENSNYLFDLTDEIVSKNNEFFVDKYSYHKSPTYLDNIIMDNFPLCIDSYDFGNLSRFMNHSCNPNVISMRIHSNNRDLLIPRIHFFSIRNIDEGEELTITYNCCPLSNKNKKECACEGVSCKGYYT